MYAYLLWAALACVAVFALSVEIGGQARGRQGELTFAQWHHGYLGILVFGLGLLLRLLAGHQTGWATGVQSAALVLLEDDAAEHLTQAVTGQLDYHAPAHVIFYFLFGKLGLVKQADAALNDGAKAVTGKLLP